MQSLIGKQIKVLMVSGMPVDGELVEIDGHMIKIRQNQGKIVWVNSFQILIIEE